MVGRAGGEQEGRTALMAEKGSRGCVEALVTAGAAVDAADKVCGEERIFLVKGVCLMFFSTTWIFAYPT